MIVVAGESLVDLVVGADGVVEEAVGGSALNVAVGLGRLQTPALLLTEAGNDERGGRIVQQVTASGAELVASPPASGRTPTSTATLDAQGGASYDFDVTWTLPRQALPPCDALHVGTLGTILEPGRASVLDLVDQAGARDVPVSYDPNIRPAFVDDAAQAWRQVLSIAGRCRIVKLSDQDIEVLHPGEDPDDVAASVLAGERTDLVVVTRGAHGSTASVEGLTVAVPAPPCDVVDTVGAGDAFVAALLTVLHDTGELGPHGAGTPRTEAGLRQLLAAANTVAALTCARRGAQPPTRVELPHDWPESPLPC